jgi:hypothetical protein
MPRNPQLHIGLLVDSVQGSKYVYEFAKWAKTKHDILAVTHLIVHAPSQMPSTARPRNFLSKLFGSLQNEGVHLTLSKALYKLIVAIEVLLLMRNERHKNHFANFDISAVVPNKIQITPNVSKSGFVYRFDAADIKVLKDLNLDLLIRCGNNILRGDILEASRLGIISFHHADNRINRGGPAGFWEVYFRQDTTGFTIQRLTEELDGGDVLMRGHFQTRYYYLLNQAALFEKSNRYLKSLIEKIALTGRLPDFLPKLPYTAALFRSPKALQSAVYLLRLFGVLARKAFWRLRGIDYRWSVAYARRNWRDAVFWRAKKLENPRSHFLADPFVVSRNGRACCFVEDFDFRTRLGKIAVYELSGDGSKGLGIVLDEPFHLSFPYIFEFRGELYMCPESSANRDIRIYKCLDFPLRWRLEKVAMNDIAAADTMIFERNGKWWMLTNTDPIGEGDYCTELSIFHSDSPLGESWTPHPLNPVFVDAGRARNAGLLRDGASSFRVSQGQGFELYGKRTLINEIIELTESNYVENTIAVIEPEFAADAVGTHHLHSNGEYTVFDFVTGSRTNA